MVRLTPSQLEALEKELNTGGDVADTSSRRRRRSRLHDAAQEGDLPRVKLLLRFGANVHALDDEGTQPTHMAVISQLSRDDELAAVQVLGALLAAGANVDAQDHNGNTPLSLAYRNDLPFCVRALIRAGADPSICGSRGKLTPHFVVDLMRNSDGALAVAKILATGIDINAKDKNGHTLLDRAALCGSPSAVTALLRAGANAGAKTRRPPLCSAALLMQQEGGAESVRALAEAGADIQGERGIRPLHQAVKAKSPAAVRLLLQLGADPHATSDGSAAIHLASQGGKEKDCREMINILLQAGADVNIQDGGHSTALHMASRHGFVSAVRLLLTSGADPRICDWYGHTALHGCGIEVASDLLEAGIDINAKGRDGGTPLHYASQYNRPPSIQPRLELGADPHICDHRGITAFKYAIKSPNAVEVVLAYLRAGVDVDVEDTKAVSLLLQGDGILNATDDVGATLLHYTSRRSSPSVNRLLLELGADLNICDSNGRTPLLNLICREDAQLLPAILKSSTSHSPLLSGLRTTPHSGLAPDSVSLCFWAAITQHVVTQQIEMKTVLALITRLGIESEHKKNQSGLSDFQREGYGILIRGLREKMLAVAQSPPARDMTIRHLAQLYNDLRRYPIDAALDKCEVVLLGDRPTQSGGFADCWQGLFLGRYKVAMKTPRGRFADEVKNRRLVREAKVWSHLNHPNILPFLGLCELDSMSFLVSPWMENGHAFEFVQKHPEADCLQLLAQVAKGLEYLHAFNPPVIHGDLRGPNILISEFGNAYIADFGLSELNLEGYDPRYSTPWLIAGHPRWQAPETIKATTKEEARRNVATDIFAFGRVMLELFTKAVPFSYILVDFQVMLLVMQGNIPKRPFNVEAVSRGLSGDMWKLMLNCWDVDPSQRPNAESIVAQLNTALGIRNRINLVRENAAIGKRSKRGFPSRPTKRVKF